MNNNLYDNSFTTEQKKDRNNDEKNVNKLLIT